jgi:phosphate/sulfate permease
LANSHKVESVFLTPLIALVFAAAFPWLFEKYIVKRK